MHALSATHRQGWISIDRTGADKLGAAPSGNERAGDFEPEGLRLVQICMSRNTAGKT